MNNDQTQKLEPGKTGFFKSMFGKVLDVGIEVIKQVAVGEALKMESVTGEIEKQKTRLGKEALWKIAPFVAFGGLLLFFLGKGKVR